MRQLTAGLLVLALLASLVALGPPSALAQPAGPEVTRTAVERVAGSDRIATAVAASRRLFPTATHVAPAAVVAYRTRSGLDGLRRAWRWGAGSARIMRRLDLVPSPSWRQEAPRRLARALRSDPLPALAYGVGLGATRLAGQARGAIDATGGPDA